jgi:hypothetical protein
MKDSSIYKTFRYPASRGPGLRKRIDQLRHRGHGGGYIFKHRAMFTAVQRPSKFMQGLILVVVLTVAWMFLINRVALVWANILDFWRSILGLGGYVVILHYQILDLFRVDVPYFPISSGGPGFVVWWIGALATLFVIFVSFILPQRHLPLKYLMRILALFQGCSQVFFAFIPLEFPYAASGYVHGMLIVQLVLLSIIPVLVGLTYYVFDFSFLKKLVLTVMIMVYMIILAPLLYMAHAYILHNYSLLFLPLLFFVFGLPLNVLIFIAFYSWGASWKDIRGREEFVASPAVKQAPGV